MKRTTNINQNYDQFITMYMAVPTLLDRGTYSLALFLDHPLLIFSVTAKALKRRPLVGADAI